LRQVLALREAIAILAQVPRGRRQAAVMNLKDLIHDRDNEVYGLLFQQGLTFFIRLRHADQNTLKAATERMVSALAPGPPSQLQEVVRATGSVDRISGRLDLKFLRPIELRTPLDDLAQNGIVHIREVSEGSLPPLGLASTAALPSLPYRTIGNPRLDLQARIWS
jgi:hypothetical protein